MKKKNWFWGIVLVLAGLLVLTGQFGLFSFSFNWFTVLATIVVAAILIDAIATKQPLGIFLSLALLYLIWQKSLGLPKINFWILLLAAALVGSGISMLFKKKPAYLIGGGYYGHGGGGPAQPQNAQANTQEVYNMDENQVYAKVSFGSSTRYLHSTCLESAQFYTSFGSLDVYFDQAQLAPGGARVYVDCSFGSINLYVPRHWNVQAHISPTLGGVNNETSFAQPGPGSPVLDLDGYVQMGSVEVIYV